MTETAAQTIASVVDKHDAELVELRRDLHMHPELSWAESRTTDLVAARVAAAGWRVTRMPRTGLVAEIGTGRRVVALRADMDGLPVQDVSGEPWASTVGGLAHACGHDVHVAALVGAALALARVAEDHPFGGRVRLLLQPAEEVMPGGALHLIAQGVLEDVEQVFALHCDPAIDVGSIGLRTGSLTSAADRIEVRCRAPVGTPRDRT